MGLRHFPDSAPRLCCTLVSDQLLMRFGSTKRLHRLPTL